MASIISRPIPLHFLRLEAQNTSGNNFSFQLELSSCLALPLCLSGSQREQVSEGAWSLFQRLSWRTGRQQFIENEQCLQNKTVRRKGSSVQMLVSQMSRQVTKRDPFVESGHQHLDCSFSQPYLNESSRNRAAAPKKAEGTCSGWQRLCPVPL